MYILDTRKKNHELNKIVRVKMFVFGLITAHSLQ